MTTKMTLDPTANEREYLRLLETVLVTGAERTDRTGVGTRSLFGEHLRFDLQAGFPLLTTKKVATKAIVGELLWFLSGSTDVADLQRLGVSIWDEWATPAQCAKFQRGPGQLGPVYGHQWRNFGATEDDHTFTHFLHDGVDQIAWVQAEIRKAPDSRRLIVTGWNPQEASKVALPPCHTLFQFYVQAGRLSCHLYQRSADMFLGVPFNIASYALLTHMMAQTTGLQVGQLNISFGDCHIYSNHVDQVREQLSRAPREAPTLELNKEVKDVCAFISSDFMFTNYHPHPAIKADVAV